MRRNAPAGRSSGRSAPTIPTRGRSELQPGGQCRPVHDRPATVELRTTARSIMMPSRLRPVACGRPTRTALDHRTIRSTSALPECPTGFSRFVGDYNAPSVTLVGTVSASDQYAIRSLCSSTVRAVRGRRDDRGADDHRAVQPRGSGDYDIVPFGPPDRPRRIDADHHGRRRSQGFAAETRRVTKMLHGNL